MGHASASLRETRSAFRMNVVSKNVISTEICMESSNNGEHCAACHCVVQFEGSSDASC
jgi:hypothetical protein